MKAQDPQELAAWYAETLAFPRRMAGSLAFDGPESTGMTVFAHFPLSTDYFGQGDQHAMVNFRVDDLDGLLAKLTAAGVRIDPKRDDYLVWAICVDLGSRREPGGAVAAAVRR